MAQGFEYHQITVRSDWPTQFLSLLKHPSNSWNPWNTRKNTKIPRIPRKPSNPDRAEIWKVFEFLNGSQYFLGWCNNPFFTSRYFCSCQQFSKNIAARRSLYWLNVVGSRVVVRWIQIGSNQEALIYNARIAAGFKGLTTLLTSR